MKRLLSILFVFLFLFSACKKQPLNEETTTKSNFESLTNEKIDEMTTNFSYPKENITNPTQLTNHKNDIVDITYNGSNVSEEKIQNSSPMIVFIGLNELKEVKKAYDTMSADNFQVYMENEHVDTYMTGMWDYESSTDLLDEMCSTYVPVLDNNSYNLSEIAFYWQSNSIHQLIIFDGEKRASVIVNTVENTKPKELNFEEEAICVSEKTIEKDNYTACLYEYKNTDYRFYAEISVDNTYIILRSNWVDSMEDFEECFNRLTFVKIGDLLSE